MRSCIPLIFMASHRVWGHARPFSFDIAKTLMKTPITYALGVIPLMCLIPLASALTAGPVIIEQSGATTHISNESDSRLEREERHSGGLRQRESSL